MFTQSSKFGAVVTAGYHRVSIKVTGDSASWTTFTNAGALQNVTDALNNAGIGFENIFYNTSYSADPFAFSFTVVVVAPDFQSDNDVLQLVLAAVSDVMTNAVGTIIQGNAATAQNQSLGQSLADIANGAAAAAAKNTAFSITTPIVIGAVVIAAMLLFGPVPGRR